MNKTSSISGIFALMVAHCAGMIDLVALPVWVGSMIQYYQFDPQQAGSLATLFLFGAVFASIILAHRLHSCNGRWVAVSGFALAAVFFGLMTAINDYASMAILHAAAGISVGAALSVTHGTIAHSLNPHKLFAIVGTALGIFSILFLGATPKLIAVTGGSTLFMVFAIIMLIVALVASFAFPLADSRLDSIETDGKKPVTSNKIPTVVWFGIIGISCMGLVQAMTFSFLERVGDHNGYGLEAITGVLIALGIVNLFPAPLAGLFERRLSVRLVLFIGPLIHATFTAIIMTTSVFGAYAVAASLFAAVMIFTHTFAFGVLSRLDTSGRAMAATPAMLMIGAGIGPILGGTLVKYFGYSSLGISAIVIAVLAVFCFFRVQDNGIAISVREQLS